MFTDRITLKLNAGKGGNGVVTWRRERYIPKGGPTGGNGGQGGSIVIKATTHESSLDSLRRYRNVKAENGQQGGPNRRQGRRGKSKILSVPCGTLIKDSETGELLCDLTEDGQEWIVCKGGRGGLGNYCFKRPTNQAPNYATDGKPGEERKVELELKLIADVGLVGFPNAGKSTFISAVAPVRVKIAPYPFTTLRPNLGYIEFEDYTRLLIADIPGIIEGAHDNRGLGHEFLRHIERTNTLIFVLDASGIDGRHPLDDFTTLRREIELYDSQLKERRFYVLLNKIDSEGAAEKIAEFKAEYPYDPSTLFEVSALTGEGIKPFVDLLHAAEREVNFLS